MSSGSDALKSAAREALRESPRLKGLKALVGFDGFVDSLSRVVRDRDAEGHVRYFGRAAEFGSFVSEAGGSRSLELSRLALKPGGNMPITAAAFASFGLGVACVGALGYPSRHPAFDVLPSSCEAYSFADPGMASALEFDDCKLMFAEMGDLHEIDWPVVKQRLGLERLRAAASAASIVALLNWSEIKASDSIWRGMLEETLDAPPPNGRRILLFDLSDCSRRRSEDLLGAIRLIAGAAALGDIVLSLNANEMHFAARAVGWAGERIEAEDAALAIRSFLASGSVVVHYKEGAVSANSAGLSHSPALPVDRPLIATGSGDNFNAGYCIASLLGFGEEGRLSLGNAFAGYYRSKGVSPDPDTLTRFLDSR